MYHIVSLMMVYKYCIVNCRPNCTGRESKTVLSFPKEEELRKKKDKIILSKSLAMDLVLAMNMKPVPTIFDRKRVINKNSEINNVTLPISIPWRSPRKRLYQEDQYELFISAKIQLKTLHAWMTFFSPVGILLQRIMTMSFFLKFKILNVSDRLYQKWLRFTCPTFFQRGMAKLLPEWFHH